MKKKYISPVTETIGLYAEESVMLHMSDESTTETIWTQEKRQGWSSGAWASDPEETED